MLFWQLEDDINYPGRWYLDEIAGDNINSGYNWQFLTGDGVVDQRYRLSLTRDGVEMDFTLTDAFVVPVVSDRLKNALSFVEGVRFFELTLEREKQTFHQYYAMVTDKMIDCFDEESSVYQVFTRDDPVRPDRAGEYHSVLRLVIDPVKAAGHDIFRVKRYPTAMIVSDRIKSALDKLDLTGLKFELCA
ncbi:hypothetical protein O8B93_27770 [Agrobacterium rhizogenes]|uniref:imm11 family protein n=1 Tax=Rhizobium rhizogenes TaxID=359 RepID=UPI0022B6E088|nr:DUF1629 domain-containing protein [Rhizobium rhizogenes]MCZ7451362.1 hypothetical protein [Rhizobium rhizogenes]